MNSPSPTQSLLRLIPVEGSPLYAEVVFNLPLKGPFTYRIPEALRPLVRVGARVFVPFGRRKITGYVVSLGENAPEGVSLKAIDDLPDAAPVVSPEILSLTRWIADYYHASWGEAIKAALPAGLDDESQDLLSITETGLLALEEGNLKEVEFLLLETTRTVGALSARQLERRLKKKFRAQTLAHLKQAGWLASDTRIKRSTVGYRYERVARLTAAGSEESTAHPLLKRSPKQMELHGHLLAGAQAVSSLASLCPTAPQVLKKMEEKGLVEFSREKFERRAPSPPRTRAAADVPPRLTADQQRVHDELTRSIDRSEYATFLLFGVTGSGKTEIYMRCIQRALEMGKTAIMMVPEISLTPQTVSRFQNRFGDRVAILHSGLTARERFLEWDKVQKEQVSIVVGARSSIFAPFKNPGVIVIDEEHDTSYKQDISPRYHARDTAIVRARNENAVVILGSATPSMESLHNAETGKYRLLSLNQRVGERLLPVVRVVDMNKEKDDNKNFSILSGTLRSAIRERLNRSEQSFLFLNRRGTAHYVFCNECGFVFDCPRCSVTLTFHGRESVLCCHYCGHQSRLPGSCADCGGEVIRFTGFGTEKLEEMVLRLFPSARVCRLDRDTTRGRSAFETMHKLMHSREIDILIGTQMITKGHDFPRVTLVGVVNADLSLNIPDFRASERSFQLLTQVAGRAGRGEVPGQVIVQTQNPGHYVFDFVRDHDMDGFFRRELAFRKKLNYPPFTRMAAIEVESENERLGQDTLHKMKTALRELAVSRGDIEILGPSRAALYRIKNRFRWHIILRSHRWSSLSEVVRRFSDGPMTRLARADKVKISLDMDPVNLL
ncbi:MAG: primosomal protein N' [Nitrospinaceae bacterium]|nr:MAG: primosomal protein N' [Nitrospinaceae bacterium]